MFTQLDLEDSLMFPIFLSTKPLVLAGQGYPGDVALIFFGKLGLREEEDGDWTN